MLTDQLKQICAGRSAQFQTWSTYRSASTFSKAPSFLFTMFTGLECRGIRVCAGGWVEVEPWELFLLAVSISGPIGTAAQQHIFPAAELPSRL